MKSLKKIISALIKYLNNLLNLLDKDFNSGQFEDLTPLDNLEKDKCIEALNWAIKNKNIKNIGICGPYGSGKSSIIRTFKRIYAENKYLDISLASFKEEDGAKPNLDRLVEQSILQQIFYSIKSTKTSDSRFIRIEKFNWGKSLLEALLLIFWLFSSIILFKPELLNSISLFSELQKLSKGNESIDFGLLLFFISGLIILIMKSIRLLKSLSISKLKVAGNEVELL